MTNYSPNEQLKTIFEFSSKTVKIRNLERAHLDGSYSESLKRMQKQLVRARPSESSVEAGCPEQPPAPASVLCREQIHCNIPAEQKNSINIRGSENLKNNSQRKRKWARDCSIVARRCNWTPI